MRLLKVAAVSLVLAACNGDPVNVTIEDTTFAPSLGVDLAASTQTASGLYYRDILVGAGNLVGTGTTVAVRYSGYLADGTLFDSNPSPEPVFTFTVDVSSVIAGFAEGVKGMHAGGRRQLIIPSRLGYGAAGQGSIPPNAILVFSVEIVTAS